MTAGAATTSTTAGGLASGRVGRAVARLTLPVLLLLPALVIIVGLVGYPLAKTIWLSFTDTRLGDLINGTGTWVGLENYKEVFTDDHLRTSLVNTVVFGTACVVGTMVFGFAVALLLNQKLKGRLFFSIAVLLPWAVPSLAASAIWKMLFDDSYGFVNWSLVQLGFDHFQGYAWFADKNSAYVSIFITVVWQSFPFVALSLLAGLQTLPQETLHAAAVDGASAWQRFRLVTLPLLRPIVAVLVVFSTIWDFKIFDQIYAMAQGVPERGADTAAVSAYRESFALGHFGAGAAVAVVLFVVLLGFSIVYVRMIGREARARWVARRGWMYAAMAAVCAFALFPIYWVLITSLKPRSEIYSKTPDLWPSDPQWHQYPRVLGEGGIGRALVNSLIVASATTVICLVVGALAAYALTRFDIPLKRILMMLVLMTQMFPLVVLVIPLFVIMRNAGLLGSYAGLVLAYLAFTVPLAIWVMRGFLLGIPDDLEHAARTDGATRFGAMWRVILPLAAPGLATTAVLCFLDAWKEFMLALTFMNDQSHKTLPVVLQTFIGRGDADWGAVMAASVIYTLPVVVIFVALRKHLMRGTTAGAVKGVRLGVQAALVDGVLVAGDVEVADGVVAAVGVGGSAARGHGIAAPGFVDLQVNGFAGVDFMHTDRAGYAQAGEAILATGTTAYQPTFITADPDELVAALAVVPAGTEAGGPTVIGAHLEGPFISPARPGVHPVQACLAPDEALLARLLDAGPVSTMTLAPELPGALGLVGTLRARGVVVSAGHSDATAAQANAAFDRGVRTVTHLFNAMRPMIPRDPGIALAALAREDVAVQVIADLHHVAAETLLTAWRAARGRFALVTDAVAAVGMDDGEFVLAGRHLTSADGVVRGPEGQLAGSVLTMVEAVRNLHGLGVPLEDALTAASTIPARIAGLDDAGELRVGAPADVVVLGDDLEVLRVLVAGRERVNT